MSETQILRDGGAISDDILRVLREVPASEYATVLALWGFDDKEGAYHLDAVQGSSEARTELYTEVLQGSTGAADEVMRQESAGLPAQLESRADGEGVWNA